MSREVNFEKKIKRRALILGLSKTFFTVLVFENFSIYKFFKNLNMENYPIQTESN